MSEGVTWLRDIFMCHGKFTLWCAFVFEATSNIVQGKVKLNKCTQKIFINVFNETFSDNQTLGRCLIEIFSALANNRCQFKRFWYLTTGAFHNVIRLNRKSSDVQGDSENILDRELVNNFWYMFETMLNIIQW